MKNYLKYFIICFVLFSASCNKNKNIVLEEVPFTKVKGLSLVGDTCYIKNVIKKDSDYTINSQEEFDLLFECKINYSPGIDFSKYTLLAGYRFVHCVFPSIAKENVFVDEKNKEIIYNASFNYNDGCYDAHGTIYYHVLIPKYQKDLYTFNVNIEIIYF